MVPTSLPSRSRTTDSALEDHCRRVSGIANLIAHHLFLITEEKETLHTACLLHHRDDRDACRATANVRSVLAAFGKPSSGIPAQRKLAAILRLSDAFDREFQAQPFQHQGAAEILAGLQTGVAKGLWPRQILAAFQECTRPVHMPSRSEWHIPVFPLAAMRTLEAMRNQAASISHVVDAARRDPATAGAIMQLANSALYCDRGDVSTLQLAVVRLGLEIARKVVASLAMRPLLYLPKLESLWPHSIEVADLAEQLAGRAEGIDPGEAYLAGLLHDVGRIALRATTLYNEARLHGLDQCGCPAVYAEDLILRTDHTILGAQIAAAWKLPERLISAIREHHRPETATGRLAHLLYLAEYLTGSKEDLPSPLRLERSLAELGLGADDLEGCARSDVGTWLAAA
jgi:putative nucleotidyltransferase with HDIG domain